MGRTLIFDKTANESFKKILDKNESSSGLLVGCIDDNKDYILYVIPTPIDTDKEQNKIKQLYDENWIVNHALQIHDMLIGGVDIVGIYCIDIQANNARQLLTNIFKSLNDFPYYKQMNFNTERVLFQVDSSSKNVLMKTIDISNQKSTPQKCDMLVQDNLSNDFYTINSNYDMNSVFTMPNVYNHELLKQYFYSALSTDFMFDKNRFLCLINNQLFSDDKKFVDLLAILKKKKKNNSINNNNTFNESELDGDVTNSINNSNLDDDDVVCVFGGEDNSYSATLLENLSQSTSLIKTTTETSKSDLPQNLDSIYHVTGVCSSVIFFNKLTTIKSIKRKLIYDIMRSLFARLRLLTDDLDARKEIIGDAQLEDPNSVEESYQTPNRIYISIDEKNNKKFLISDYVFPDETSADIIDRIRELFSYEIKDPDNQIFYIEKFPPEIQNVPIDDNCPTIDIEYNKNLNEKNTIKKESSNILNNLNKILTPIFILIISLIVYWFYSSK